MVESIKQFAFQKNVMAFKTKVKKYMNHPIPIKQVKIKGGNIMIIGSRIDGRLIHGQVSNLWSHKLGVDRFIVVDDKVAESDIEKSGLRLATPSGIRLSVLPLERAAKQINEDRYKSQRVMIVARRPKTFLELVNRGVDIKELNVGNMSQTSETRSITNSINVTDEDVKDFEELENKGVRLYSQMVPNDNAKDFMKILKK